MPPQARLTSHHTRVQGANGGGNRGRAPAANVSHPRGHSTGQASSHRRSRSHSDRHHEPRRSDHGRRSDQRSDHRSDHRDAHRRDHGSDSRSGRLATGGRSSSQRRSSPVPIASSAQLDLTASPEALTILGPVANMVRERNQALEHSSTVDRQLQWEREDKVRIQRDLDIVTKELEAVTDKADRLESTVVDYHEMSRESRVAEEKATDDLHDVTKKYKKLQDASRNLKRVRDTERDKMEVELSELRLLKWPSSASSRARQAPRVRRLPASPDARFNYEKEEAPETEEEGTMSSADDEPVGAPEAGEAALSTPNPPLRREVQPLCSNDTAPEVMPAAASQAPTSVLKPTASEVPTAVLKPAASEVPTAVLLPAASEAPTAEHTPAASEAPTAVHTPAASEAPTAVPMPAAGEVPPAEAYESSSEEEELGEPSMARTTPEEEMADFD